MTMPPTTVTDILDADQLSRLNLPVAEARGLPPEAYTCDALFDLEQERLFRRTWMGAAFVQDIPGPGDALPLTIAGVRVIVLRDREGVIRAFHNVCRHRASTVLQEPCKSLRHLQCPYHRWTYDLDGRLKATPLWDGTPKGKNYKLDPDENALVPIRCDTWENLIFVNISGDAATLDKYVEPLIDEWADYDLNAIRPFAQADSVIEANWKVVTEGALEVYHEEFVHADLIYRVNDGEQTWDDILDGDAMGFRAMEMDDDPNRPASSLPKIPGMPPEGATPTYVMFLFPSISINVYDNHVVRTIWLAPSRTETRWRSTWCFAAEAVETPVLRKECQAIVDLWLAVREEDRGIVQLVQAGHQSPGPGPREVRFSPFWEGIILHFQRHVVSALS